MILQKLHKLLFFIIVLLSTNLSFADTQFRFMTGTKSQTLNSSGQTQAGSGAPLGLIAFVDFETIEKLYISFGTSFEFLSGDLNTSGFSIYGKASYYLYGHPGTIKSNTEAMNMDLFYPYSIYASLGFFQKDIKVVSLEDGSTSDEKLGGLLFGLGGNYNLSHKMFVTSHIQMLMNDSKRYKFSSTEFYIGIGLRL